MADLSIQLKDYRLTTAKILYHLPDYPKLLQSYLWQEYDIAPEFPELKKFLNFWSKEIEGPLHSVFVASKEIITPGDARFYETEITLQ
jgi:uncharacterized protein Usg